MAKLKLKSKISKSNKKSLKDKKLKNKKSSSSKKNQTSVHLPLKKIKQQAKVSKTEQKTQDLKKKRYYEAVGRRKSAVARIRLFTSSPTESAKEGNLIINDKSYKKIFPSLELQKIIEAPLKHLKSFNRFSATIRVRGGGLKGQAEAIGHGLARSLLLFDSNFRKKLRKEGFLTCDSRKKERKKFGLKKARRAPQWSKR